MLDKDFHADLIDDLYNHKFVERTRTLYNNRETMFNPFPKGKSFDDFIAFITSRESKNFMVEAVNIYERKVHEEPTPPTEIIVVDDSGDEENFQFPDECAPLSNERRGPRVRTTVRTVSIPQPSTAQQTPQKEGKKGKGTPKSGKKKGQATNNSKGPEKQGQILSPTTNKAQQNHSEMSSLQQVADTAIPVTQPTKLENGLTLLDCYDRLQNSFRNGKETPIDNTRKIAIRKEIESCLTSEKHSDFKYTQRNINNLVKIWSKGIQTDVQNDTSSAVSYYSAHEDNDTNDNDEASNGSEESSNIEKSENMDTDENVDEIPFAQREDFQDSLGKKNSPSKQNITTNSTHKQSTPTDTTQQPNAKESTAIETTQQQPKLGTTAKLIQQVEAEKAKKTQNQQKEQQTTKPNKRKRGGKDKNTPQASRQSKRLKGKGIAKR